MMLHNSHQPFFRQPQGPAPAGSAVTIRFKCDEATAVILRTWQDEELCYAMRRAERDVWETTVSLPDKPGLYWYRFIVYRADGHTAVYGNAADKLGGEGMVWQCGEAESFQITVFDPDYHTPPISTARTSIRFSPTVSPAASLRPRMTARTATSTRPGTRR